MKTLALIDTETSDVEETKGRLLEVGLVLWSVKHRAIIRARSWLVQGATENAALAVNGIKPALLTRGDEQEQIEKQLHNIAVKEVDAFVAFNVEFDRKWFSSAVQNVKPWMCAMDDFEYPRASIAKSLTAVALAHGVGVVDAHRALSDCMTMARLFERVAELLDLNDSAGSPRFEEWLAQAARPRATFELADKNFDAARNELAKANGFRWVAEKKSWRRRLAIEDAKAMPFRVQEVQP